MKMNSGAPSKDRGRSVLIISTRRDDAQWIGRVVREELAGAEVTLVVRSETVGKHRAEQPPSTRLISYPRKGIWLKKKYLSLGPFRDAFIFWERRSLRARRLRLLALATGCRRFRSFIHPDRPPKDSGRARFLLDFVWSEVLNLACRIFSTLVLVAERPLLWLLGRWSLRRRSAEARSDLVHFFVSSFGLGGAQRQIINQVRGLRRRGIDSKVWLLYPEDNFYTGRFEAEGGSWESVWHSRRMPRFSRLMHELWACVDGRSFAIPALTLAALLRREHPIVLQTMLDRPNVIGSLAARLAGVPVVVGGWRNVHPREFPHLSSMDHHCYRRMDWRLFDAVIANSRAGGQNYAAWEPRFPIQKLRVVYNGIDESMIEKPGPETLRVLRKKLGIPDDVPVITCVGRLAPEKRVDVFLMACEELARSGPDFRAIVVGHGDQHDALEQLKDDLGLEQRVIFTGGRDDVHILMALASVVVQTSVAEGMPNSLMEAQLMNRPVVATRAGGTPELVEDGVTGFLVETNDHHAVAEKIRKLLSDHDSAQRMVCAARARILESFSTEKMVESTLAIYRELAAAKGLTIEGTARGKEKVQ